MHNSNSEEGINVIDDSKMIFNNSEVTSKRYICISLYAYKGIQCE